MTKDIILVLIVLAGVLSFFYNPQDSENIKYLQIIMGGIVGYYTGVKAIPLASVFKKNK